MMMMITSNTDCHSNVMLTTEWVVFVERAGLSDEINVTQQPLTTETATVSACTFHQLQTCECGSITLSQPSDLGLDKHLSKTYL